MQQPIYDNREVTIGSTTLTLKEWAKRSRISFYTLRWRVDQGWPVERLFERRKSFQDGMKACSKCGETKPSEAFYARSRGGWYSECKACHKKRVIVAYKQEAQSGLDR